jgi:hypothetical protein
MRLVVGGGADPKIDSAILKAVARANQWLTELLSGRFEVAGCQARGSWKHYVSRIVRLAFLAPSIIEQMPSATSHPNLPPKRFLPAATAFL